MKIPDNIKAAMEEVIAKGNVFYYDNRSFVFPADIAWYEENVQTPAPEPETSEEPDGDDLSKVGLELSELTREDMKKMPMEHLKTAAVNAGYEFPGNISRAKLIELVTKTAE